MNRGKQYINRWKTDFDFKTVISASGSLAATAIFAFYNGFLGIRHASLWYGTICVYYLILVILRGIIITAEKKTLRDKREDRRSKVYITVSALLLILNLSLIIPISLMVVQQKPVNLTLIPAIAMAAYTTYKIIMASVNLKRRKRSSDSLVRLLRTISFIDALVSILTLQNTLIMVNSNGEDTGLLPLTAATSAAVFLAVMLLSVAAIIKGIVSIKNRE